MRIAVSDFDGTMKIGGELNGDVVGAVRAWRAAGNRFGIATGRDLWMTVHETDLWSIPFDFLICINGAAVYDAGRNLLAIREFGSGLLAELLRHPAAMASSHYLLLGSRPIRFYQRGESWFPGMDIPHAAIGFDEALELGDVAQVSLSYDNPEEAERWVRRLRADFGEHAAAFKNGRCIDVNRAEVNKATGIAAMLDSMGWEDDGLVVFGDGGNDMEMIRAYEGYTLPHGIPEVKALARGVFPDLPGLLAGV